MNQAMKCLLIIPLIFFAGCEKDSGEKIMDIQLIMAQKHLDYHEEHGFNFEKPCSGCNPAISNGAVLNKTQNSAQAAATMSTISALNSGLRK